MIRIKREREGARCEDEPTPPLRQGNTWLRSPTAQIAHAQRARRLGGAPTELHVDDKKQQVRIEKTGLQHSPRLVLARHGPTVDDQHIHVSSCCLRASCCQKFTGRELTPILRNLCSPRPHLSRHPAPVPSHLVLRCRQRRSGDDRQVHACGKAEQMRLSLWSTVAAATHEGNREGIRIHGTRCWRATVLRAGTGGCL